MTQEEFTNELEGRGYTYEIVDGKVVVTDGGNFYGNVNLPTLTSLPPNVEFNNRGSVGLVSLIDLPQGTKFNNGGSIDLTSLKIIHSGVVFNNKDMIDLRSLESIPQDVMFNNEKNVILPWIWLNTWGGNIEGIDNKRLLNLMISKGVFER
jgi:hypothetical protein